MVDRGKDDDVVTHGSGFEQNKPRNTMMGAVRHDGQRFGWNQHKIETGFVFPDDALNDDSQCCSRFQRRRRIQLIKEALLFVLRRFFPPRPEVNERLVFMYADSITTTKGGFKVMAASSFLCTNSNCSLFTSLASPMEVILGSNVEHQLYCHLLCGLRNSDSIDAIHTTYALDLIRAFRALIGVGFCINYGQMFDMLNVSTGSMKQYYSKLKYFAGEIPLLGGDYFSSECPVTINLDIKQPPDQTIFVMLPTTGYFEFLPFNSTENDVFIGEETVELCGVEVGKMYEVVVTTYRGFYRYRLGDIVRVVGFYNSSSLLEFVMRAPKTSFEIVTEGDLMAAMETFQLGMRNTLGLATEIVDFTSSVDFDCSPKRLKIFIEGQDCDTILQEKLQGSELRKCCSTVEDGLGSSIRCRGTMVR
ncbi:putative indole-3-acetic acid-amido synthetase GH3.6-like isoform X2 [Hibiscus syriacus]|uniref:Indole-3-acetic acid-amido synthetase GH3.6-like isoform X2 n=1 Tax=Hibiscus syriacus TaxID=106335 RepID=A0A6A2YIL9_HIBSY|nr:putative indole-3-acetic acid-amido synthetase GH3.6-like isoform X2 [Hibiscus syriacus]